MGFFDKIISFFKKDKTEPKLSIKEIALHEAAHGIVWCLFRDNWTIHQLTIDREKVNDKSTNGELHITPNFNTKTESTIERANEITAIACAGLIGQNMDLIRQDDNLIIKMMNVNDYCSFLNKTGCGGDFEIVRRYSPHLGHIFKVSESGYVRYKIMDLIDLFQSHDRVQHIHLSLARLLLEKKTLKSDELIEFFNSNSFNDYIYEEDLDTSFFHREN